MHKTSALVIPGGADLPYCKILNGEGNKKITQFVKKGGKFIGFCAGGYYGSGRCEFQVGTSLEVSGSRELSFFPGTARGCAFPGFVYESHKGAKSVQLKVEGDGDKESLVYNYYNGGGAFVNASQYANTKVLARYVDKLGTPGNEGDDESAAVIVCKVGKGAALLTGSHPEFTPVLMKPSKETEPEFFNAFEHLKLEENDHQRKLFMKYCLSELGLKVNEDVNMSIPQLTPIYVLSLKPESIFKLCNDLEVTEHNNKFEDTNDTFIFHGDNENDSDYFISEKVHESNDLDSIPKHIKLSTELPPHKLTPYFNIATYREHLKKLSGNQVGEIGATFGYSEVVTSTNTLLDKNPGLLSKLPHGFTLTATTQVAGRGRSGNVWVNPKGVMATSVLFKIPVEKKVNIITLQYLCGLSVVELILSYGSDIPGQGAGYEELPIKLKWPNDIYSMKPEYLTAERINNQKVYVPTSSATTLEQDEEIYSKISGSIINSQYLQNAFHLVLGVGINVSNAAPSICLNNVLDKLNELRAKRGQSALPHFQHEILLAKILHTTEQFFNVFVNSGIKPFLPLYYKRWFHSGQTVDLDAKGNGERRKCIIKGITPEYGLLIVEDIKNGEVLELQPDGNSFDIFRGLIYKKS